MRNLPPGEYLAHVKSVIPKGFHVAYEIGDCVVIEANNVAVKPTLEELVDKLESHSWNVGFRRKNNGNRCVQLVMQIDRDYRVKTVDVESTYYATLEELAGQVDQPGGIKASYYPVAKRKGRPR
jgi:hypothetical protein